MYIRIEFKDTENDETKKTQRLFFSTPNGMFLSSLHAQMLSSKEMREVVGISVLFWYLDIHVLNKYYGGDIYCLNELLKYPGVRRVDMLPIKGQYCDEKYDELMTILMQYINI
jgi:hypothetical protein